MKLGDELNHNWIDSQTGKDRRKCPKHGCWMKKYRYTPELGPICEPCRLEAEARKREYEKTGGSNKPPVKIGRL